MPIGDESTSCEIMRDISLNLSQEHERLMSFYTGQQYLRLQEPELRNRTAIVSMLCCDI